MKRATFPVAALISSLTLVAACHDDTSGHDSDGGDAFADVQTDDTSDTGDTGDAGPGVTPELLSAWARVPPTDALEQLGVWILDEQLDVYTRERAVFVATEIATRQRQPDVAIGILTQAAAGTEVPQPVRSAAWANLRVLDARFPSPPTLSLALSIEQHVRVGQPITVECDAHVPAEASEARLNVEIIDERGSLVAHQIFDVDAGVSTPVFGVEFTPATPGEYYVSVDLRADLTAVDTERVTRRARIVVDTETGGAWVFED